MKWLVVISWVNIGSPQFERPIETTSLSACKNIIEVKRKMLASQGKLSNGFCYEQTSTLRSSK